MCGVIFDGVGGDGGRNPDNGLRRLLGLRRRVAPLSVLVTMLSSMSRFPSCTSSTTTVDVASTLAAAGALSCGASPALEEDCADCNHDDSELEA